MIFSPYLCVLVLFNSSTFYWDLDLLLTFLSLPIAIKLIIEMHTKYGKELNEVLIGTSNFMRVFFILLMLGILL